MNDYLELRRVALIVLKRWWLVVVLTILGAILGYTVSQRQTKVYQATTTLLVGQTIFATELDRQDILANELVAQSYREMVRRQPVMQGVVDRLNLGMSWENLKSRVRVDLLEGTQLLQIKVEDGDRQTAQIIADEVANQTIIFSPVELPTAGNEDTRRFVLDQLDSLQARIENGQNQLAMLQIELVTTDSAEALSELQAQVTTLEGLINDWENNYTQLLTFLQSGQLPQRLTIIEPAQASRNPVRPQVQLFVLVGAGIGLALALGLIFLLEFMDDTLRSSEDVTREFGLPVLGTIADLGRSKDGSIGVYVAQHPRSPVAEAFRLLRANLELIAVEHPLNTLLITSCDRGVGKSSVSSNLAMIMAQSDREIILLDADLRKSTIHEQMNLPNEYGLSDMIRSEGDIDVDKAKQKYAGLKGGVITGGTPPPNPSELLGSKKMDQILERLKESSDVVVVDAPPLIVSDSLVLSAKVDGVLLVVRPGYTQKKLVKTTMEQLNRAGASVIGVVLNGVTEKGVEYYGPEQYPPAEYTEGPYPSEEAIEADGRLPVPMTYWSALLKRLSPVTSAVSSSRERIASFVESARRSADQQPSFEDRADPSAVARNGGSPGLAATDEVAPPPEETVPEETEPAVEEQQPSHREESVELSKEDEQPIEVEVPVAEDQLEPADIEVESLVEAQQPDLTEVESPAEEDQLVEAEPAVEEEPAAAEDSVEVPEEEVAPIAAEVAEAEDQLEPADIEVESLVEAQQPDLTEVESPAEEEQPVEAEPAVEEVTPVIAQDGDQPAVLEDVEVGEAARAEVPAMSDASDDGREPQIRVRAPDGKKPKKVVKTGKFCPNPDCSDFEKKQSRTQKNIRKAGKSKKGVQRFQCKTCRKTFTQTTGTLFFRKRTPEHEILETLALIAEGNRVSDLSREKGYRKDTILQWLREAAENPEQVNDVLIKKHHVEPAQLEALWTDVREGGVNGNLE